MYRHLIDMAGNPLVKPRNIPISGPDPIPATADKAMLNYLLGIKAPTGVGPSILGGLSAGAGMGRKGMKMAGSILASKPGLIALSAGAALGAESIIEQLMMSRAQQQREATAQLNPMNQAGSTGSGSYAQDLEDWMIKNASMGTITGEPM